MRECRVSIDSGENLGVAVWDAARWRTLCPPLRTAVLVPSPRARSYVDKTQSVGERLWALLDAYTVTHMYVEWPIHMDSAKGHAAAVEGNIIKLAYNVGWLGCIAYGKGAVFVPVPVNQWKGQLPKRVVQRRLRAKLGKWYGDHAADAVGIGLNAKGYF
jgi:hypothetical protein